MPQLKINIITAEKNVKNICTILLKTNYWKIYHSYW